MRIFVFFTIALLLSSCLKKIEEVDSANTNIFDPDYAGEQWWSYDDVYLYTNSNNDQFVHFDFSIPQEKAPKLKPPTIDVSVKVNGGDPHYTGANIYIDGSYKGGLNIPPTGETSFCLEIGIFVESDTLIINEFTDCMSL